MTRICLLFSFCFFIFFNRLYYLYTILLQYVYEIIVYVQWLVNVGKDQNIILWFYFGVIHLVF